MLSALPLLGLASLACWGTQVCPCRCAWPERQGRRGLQGFARQTRQLQPHQRRHRHRLRGSEEFPPYIIDQPTDLVVLWDQPATLHCRVAGSPPPTVEWYRNGQYVETSKDNAYSQRTLLPDGSLFFLRLNQRKGQSDEGIYSCVATNPLGTARSQNASLYVAALWEDFRLQPSNLVVMVGEQVLLECAPPKGHPEPTISWKKDGVPISQKNGRYEVSSGRLLVAHAQRSDAGLYACVASNQAGERESQAALVSVLDPLDTGQREWPKDGPRELMDVQLYLDNSTVLPNLPAVYLHWTVAGPSQHAEGHAVLYRSLLPLSTAWVERKVPREHNTIVPALRRGYKYEFKVRPYAGPVHGPDSNSRHLWIPEEVPSAAPQHITIRPAADGNGTVLVTWAPPPHHAHNGIIRGYQVWYLGNGTHHHTNRTVDGETHSLETVVLQAGVNVCIQVAAFNGAGLGVPSNATCSSLEPLLGKMARVPAGFSFSHILAGIRQPVVIASVGSLLWLLLLVLAVYLCQQHARHYSRGRQGALGKGLGRYASEDDFLWHRRDVSNSPWLADSWKAASCSRNGSGSSRSSSQLLWAATKESPDFNRSTMSFDRQSQSSQVPAALRASDSSSLYRVLYVDLPARDMQTFHGPPQPSPPDPHLRATKPGGSTSHRPGPCYNQSLGVECGCMSRAGNRGLWKPASPRSSSLTLQRCWESSSKRELQQAPSPLAFSASPSHAPGTGSSRKLNAGEGEEAKLQKTCSFPRRLQSSGSLHQPGTLPPHPAPPPTHGPQGQGVQPESRARWEAAWLVPAGEWLLSTGGALEGALPSPSVPCRRRAAASPAPSLGDDRENVLTPDQVAEYLELSMEAECQRLRREGDFSPPHTYGYICGPLPSGLGAGPAPEEEDEPEAEGGGCHSTPFLRRCRQTPSAGPSEAGGSPGGSLLNGWGSVSEENFTSPRCSLVSSDGSFLVEANFAQALAVAGDSFCVGLSQSTACADFSPPTSPLDGLLSPLEHWQGAAWEWGAGWLEKMEAKCFWRADGMDACCREAGGKAALPGLLPQGTGRVAGIRAGAPGTG